MFNFFKKKKIQCTSVENIQDTDSNENTRSSITTTVGLVVTDSARMSTNQALSTYTKPDTYTGNRKLFDSGSAKARTKKDAFFKGSEVRDPYTGDILEIRKVDAKLKYGDRWQNHLAETDHITPIEKIFKDNGKNPWLKKEDIKNIANSDKNLEIISRKTNNAKRSRTNKELVTDDEYLKKTGVEFSEQGKRDAIESGRKSQAEIKKQVQKTSMKNVIKTGHEAGKYSAQNSGITAATMSGVMNITAVIKGEKSTEDALADTAVDVGKATATGYVLGGGLTTLSHSLSSSSSKFLQALSKSNVPGNVMTAVIVTGDTLKRYGNCEISTQECIRELGEKGLNFATAGYSMAVGQAIIPIPIVGAAVGALVGSTITSRYYNELINTLKTKELEHQERQRIIDECEIVAKQARFFREELECYLEAYFKEHQDCFDEALLEINYAFQAGDADGVIAGANRITRKLGGNIHYDTVEEFKDFLSNDSVDIL
ncbi:hypothetical protein [Romboutsia lituseburensis]|uniref:hypothetical protein n=1 Tax=Romboutsia lituseburensis TaxID=1537 RepID=UPI00215B0F59|nr:hypothetical protein [Romboutsia lituseburensis]MCR8744294.1 hypothetical protein [Romboutsia lituseburensis]